jgi:hypothetical protein
MHTSAHGSCPKQVISPFLARSNGKSEFFLQRKNWKKKLNFQKKLKKK